MCTRFCIDRSTELIPYIEKAKYSPLKSMMMNGLHKDFKESGEIRPTDITAVIAPGKDGKKPFFP